MPATAALRQLQACRGSTGHQRQPCQAFRPLVNRPGSQPRPHSRRCARPGASLRGPAASQAGSIGSSHEPFFPSSDSAGTGPGYGGSDPPKPPTGGGGSSSGGRGSEDDPEGLLSKAGQSAEDLPADLQEALREGKLSAAQLSTWLKLASTPILGALAKASSGFRNRVLADDKFLVVLGLEAVLGVGGKLVSEYNFRGDKFWKVGSYSLASRLSVIGWRGLQFLAVGTGSSIVGHSATVKLVEKQAEEHPEQDQGPEMPPVWMTSLAWGSFMAVAGNLKYQAVNAIEDRVLARKVPAGLIRNGVTGVLRFTNIYIGGIMWMGYATKIGLQ